MQNNNKDTTIKFYESVNQALKYSMKQDKNMICYGLGINDPKAIFSTTKGLKYEFGPSRVFDVPTSENALTGISVGAAINGVRSVVTHQRLDFFILALDQLINSAAKWHYMFGSKSSIPITIRLIIGRGWGQGPTHSQTLTSLFASIPGLKVVIPSNPENCYNLLLASIFDPNPVVFLEHRWLHNAESKVFKKEKIKKLELLCSKLLAKGQDLTIVSSSYCTHETLQIVKKLKNEDGICCDLIDLNVLKPLNLSKVFNSIKKTGRLLIVDIDNKTCGMGSEILSQVTQKVFPYLRSVPIKIAMPDVPVPTSFGLTRNFYFTKLDIIKNIKKVLKIKKKLKTEYYFSNKLINHDVPGKWFTGPF